MATALAVFLLRLLVMARRTLVVRGGVMVFGFALLGAVDGVLPSSLPLVGFTPVVVERRLRAPSGEADRLREDALAHAQLWSAPEIPVGQAEFRDFSKDSGAGPLRDAVACKFHPQATSGNTPKFECVFEDGEVLKVKYGSAEVHTEVVAARLLQALGFGADDMYLVNTLRCFGCPADPYPLLQCAFSPSADVQRNCGRLDRHADGEAVLKTDYSQFVDFQHVAVERRKPGKVIAGESAEGWGWEELDAAQTSGRNATRAQRDALRLMAVFLNDWDNKPANQRLLCLPGGYPTVEAGTCEQPFAFLSDLGAAFGGRGHGAHKLDVEAWKAVPIWEDARTCKVRIRSPYGRLSRVFRTKGSFGEVDISEGGRRFLADLLGELSAQQIHDLFEHARIADYADASEASKSIENWVSVFQDKVRQISDRPPCASGQHGVTSTE